jgi:hypothetical protein
LNATAAATPPTSTRAIAILANARLGRGRTSVLFIVLFAREEDGLATLLEYNLVANCA